MKKVLLAITAVIGLSSINAQEVKFGVKGGANYAYFMSDTKSKIAYPKFGFHVGGVADIKLSDKFSIQPEVLFSTQGLRFDGFQEYDHKALIKGKMPELNAGIAQIQAGIEATEAQGGDATALKQKKAGYEAIKGYLNKLNTYNTVGAEGTGHWDFRYINVPVTVKYAVTDKLNVQFGPQIGFLLSAEKVTDLKLVADGKSLEVPSYAEPLINKALAARYVVLGKHEENIKETLKTIDLGLNFGVGYDLNDNYSVGLRYGLGLTDFKKRESGDNGYSKNANLQVSFSYFF